MSLSKSPQSQFREVDAGSETTRFRMLVKSFVFSYSALSSIHVWVTCYNFLNSSNKNSWIVLLSAWKLSYLEVYLQVRKEAAVQRDQVRLSQDSELSVLGTHLSETFHMSKKVSWIILPTSFLRYHQGLSSLFNGYSLIIQDRGMNGILNLGTQFLTVE
jgi:hypothetical protein